MENSSSNTTKRRAYYLGRVFFFYFSLVVKNAGSVTNSQRHGLRGLLPSRHDIRSTRAVCCRPDTLYSCFGRAWLYLVCIESSISVLSWWFEKYGCGRFLYFCTLQVVDACLLRRPLGVRSGVISNPRARVARHQIASSLQEMGSIELETLFRDTRMVYWRKKVNTCKTRNTGQTILTFRTLSVYGETHPF